MCVFLESVNVCLFIHIHIGLFLKGSEVGPYIFTEWQQCAPYAQLHARCMLIHTPSGDRRTRAGTRGSRVRELRGTRKGEVRRREQ